MPAPPVCSQKPGFSLEWLDARPFAIAFAAGSLSDASAVSVAVLISEDVPTRREHTDDYIGFSGFLFDEIRAVKITDDKTDVWERILHRLALLLCMKLACTFEA